MNVEPNDVIELTNATMVYLIKTWTMIPQMIITRPITKKIEDINPKRNAVIRQISK